MRHGEALLKGKPLHNIRPAPPAATSQPRRQNASFKLICIFRPFALEEIVPKSRLEADTLGLLNCAWLNRLKASARKVNRVASRRNAKSFINDRLELFLPG